MHLHGASCAFRLCSPQNTNQQSCTPTTNAPNWLLIPVCVCVCIYKMALPNLPYTCVYLIPCFVCQQGCFARWLWTRVFAMQPADIDHGRDPHYSLQSLSGIWLCCRLDSSHELDFSCSHPNALVSFFYEAASQRKVAVPSFCLPSCHFIELLRMLAF